MSKEIQDKLNILKELKYNWDGDNADPISIFLINLAENILKKLHYKINPNISPSISGEVDITWNQYKLFVSLDTDAIIINNGIGSKTEVITWICSNDIEICTIQAIDILELILNKY